MYFDTTAGLLMSYLCHCATGESDVIIATTQGLIRNRFIIMKLHTMVARVHYNYWKKHHSNQNTNTDWLILNCLK